jgi:hypothetical protein
VYLLAMAGLESEDSCSLAAFCRSWSRQCVRSPMSPFCILLKCSVLICCSARASLRSRSGGLQGGAKASPFFFENASHVSPCQELGTYLCLRPSSLLIPSFVHPSIAPLFFSFPFFCYGWTHTHIHIHIHKQPGSTANIPLNPTCTQFYFPVDSSIQFFGSNTHTPTLTHPTLATQEQLLLQS